MSIVLAIPGQADIELRHAVFDLNGTLTVDGMLIEGVAERVGQLRRRLLISICTSDTMGTAEETAARLECELFRVGPPDEAEAKAELVRSLGAHATVAIGNGANDVGMLAAATLGICIMGPEGAATTAVAAADVIVADPLRSLDLLLDPVRLAATLRR